MSNDKIAFRVGLFHAAYFIFSPMRCQPSSLLAASFSEYTNGFIPANKNLSNVAAI